MSEPARSRPRYATKAEWADAEAEKQSALAAEVAARRDARPYDARAWAQSHAAELVYIGEATRFRQMAERYRRRGL
jgi:hypothetical protein